MRYDRGAGEIAGAILSDSKGKRPPTDGPLSVTGMYVPWRLGSPEPGESVRWSCVDGRWVSIALGQGDEVGKTIVISSEGAREVVEDHESALALAKRWRL
jgi:hypothetical protein